MAQTCENIQLTVSKNCDPLFSLVSPFSFSMDPVDPSVRNPDKNTVNSFTYWLQFSSGVVYLFHRALPRSSILLFRSTSEVLPYRTSLFIMPTRSFESIIDLTFTY